MPDLIDRELSKNIGTLYEQIGFVKPLLTNGKVLGEDRSRAEIRMAATIHVLQLLLPMSD